MQENLAGVRVVKAFVRANYENERFRQANHALKEQTLRAIRTMAMTMPLMMLALNFGIVAALWFGGLLVQAGSMQVGQIVAFTNYLMQALMSLMMLSMLVTRISRSEASALRIQEVLDTNPKVQAPTSPISPSHPLTPSPSHPPAGRVVFDRVSFRYDGHGREDVLRNVSFEIEPGQTVALLGATGAGKSTLAHLVPRFYDVTGGRITVDGVDVRDMDEQALRGAIGVAMQESVLFHGTLRDNIALRPPRGHR